jgi:hypothetical protein
VTRAVLLAALLVVLAVSLAPLLWRPTPDRPPRAPKTPPARTENPTVSADVPSLPERNVFEYAEARPAPAPTAAPRSVAPPVSPPAAVAEAVPEPVRLVGLVRRAGRPRAVLSILGEVVILGAGEESEGYRVMSVDEEAGVTVRAPDGSERTFSRPEP